MVTRKSGKMEEQLKLVIPEPEGAVFDLSPAVPTFSGFRETGVLPQSGGEEWITTSVEVSAYKLFEDVPLPTYATAGSMCFDLRAYLPKGYEVSGYDNLNRKFKKKVLEYSFEGEEPFYAVWIDPGDRVLISTGLVFDLPEDYGLFIHPLSGVSLKQGMKISNCTGIVDWDYIDTTFFILENTTATRLLVKHGERYAQGEVVKYPPRVNFVERRTPPTKKTTRSGGFGSTGK